METVDQIQARLRALLSEAYQARMLALRTGDKQDADNAATLMDEIEARLMQPASSAEADETPSTFTRPLQNGTPMTTLTDEIKIFIVKCLACFDTPSQIVEAVKAMFGVEVSRQQVYAYDPRCSQPPAQRWRDLHAATRQALLREQAEIGIAHRAVRLRRLDRLECRSERNNVTTALKCLEMAAKECGGMYENRKPAVLQQPVLQHPVLQQQPIMPQPVATQPVAPQSPAPLPAPPPPAMKQPSLPERPAAQARAPRPQAAPPQPAPRARPAPSLSVPLPVMPSPDRPAPSAPQPLAVPAQAPQPPALPEGRPLNRHERFLAYVRDSHARDRAVRAQALLESGRNSTMPPAS